MTNPFGNFIGVRNGACFTLKPRDCDGSQYLRRLIGASVIGAHSALALFAKVLKEQLLWKENSSHLIDMQRTKIWRLFYEGLELLKILPIFFIYWTASPVNSYSCAAFNYLKTWKIEPTYL